MTEKLDVLITDALNYLDDVKRCFHDQPHIYQQFLEIMKEFKNDQINVDNVIERIRKLFHAHPSLLLGFQTFLPRRSSQDLVPVHGSLPFFPGHPITTANSQHPSGTTSRQLSITDALNYLEGVKKCFHDQPHMYSKFLGTMKEFKNEQISVDDVVERICKLLHAHPSLLLGFQIFLPSGYRIDYPQVSANHISVTNPLGTTTTYRFDGVQKSFF